MSRTCRMRGPAPQGQPVAINLQEGQTYQIMGYLDGDKAVVKPVQTPLGETEVQNEQEAHQNAQEVHQNAQEVHQNAQEVHQNAQEVHQNAQEVHQNTQEVHQNAQEVNSAQEQEATS